MLGEPRRELEPKLDGERGAGSFAHEAVGVTAEALHETTMLGLVSGVVRVAVPSHDALLGGEVLHNVALEEDHQLGHARLPLARVHRVDEGIQLPEELSVLLIDLPHAQQQLRCPPKRGCSHPTIKPTWDVGLLGPTLSQR